MAKDSWFNSVGGDFHEASSPGLAENPRGVAFQCGTCEYFKSGMCTNKHPKLNRKVDAAWCCNLYETPKMRKIA